MLKMNEEKSDSSSFEDLGAEAAATAVVPEKNDSDEWMDVLGSGHIMKKIERKGDEENEKPQRGDICKINFTGKLENDTVVEQGECVKIQVGDGDIIQGIDLVLAMMHKGEICTVKMTSRFGYGECGLPPNIPPNADLIYTIELVDFEEEPELEEISLSERKSIGNKKRERGNWWYNNMQQPAMAIQCYSRALQYLDEAKGGITNPTTDGNLPPTSEELMSVIEDRMKTYNNMAAAQMKQGAYDAALNSVEIVLTCQPKNVKALFRKGKILSYKNNVKDALKCMRTAYNLSPDDRAVKSELAKLEEREQKDQKKERDLARKMLGTHSGNSKGSSDKDRPKNTGKKIFVWGSVVFSIAIGVISVAIYRYKLA